MPPDVKNICYVGAMPHVTIYPSPGKYDIFLIFAKI